MKYRYPLKGIKEENKRIGQVVFLKGGRRKTRVIEGKAKCLKSDLEGKGHRGSCYLSEAPSSPSLFLVFGCQAIFRF